MKKSQLLAIVCAIFAFAPISAHATTIQPLEGRLPVTPGGNDYQAYYDPNLNISWAADANVNSDIKWDPAISWVNSLTINGIGNWRLASMDVDGDGTAVDCTGGGVANCKDNEFGYLYWEESITGAAPTPFTNLNNHDWLSGSEWSVTGVWVFNFSDGSQAQASKVTGRYAWAVHDGDIGAAVIPLPAALWLFGSGLLGLIGVARRRGRV